MKSKFKPLILTLMILSPMVSASIGDHDHEQVVVNDYKEFDIKSLGCKSDVLNCIINLDAKRIELSQRFNFLFDNLKLVGGEYNKEFNQLTHTYYVNKDYEGFLIERVQDDIMDADRVLESFYCTDPLVRLAMDLGITVNYKLMLRAGDTVSDSGIEADPFSSESCSRFNNLNETMYVDVLTYSDFNDNQNKKHITKTSVSDDGLVIKVNNN